MSIVINAISVIESLAGAVSWPLVALIFIIIFRSYLADFIGEMRIRIGNVEVERRQGKIAEPATSYLTPDDQELLDSLISDKDKQISNQSGQLAKWQEIALEINREKQELEFRYMDTILREHTKTVLAIICSAPVTKELLKHKFLQLSPIPTDEEYENVINVLLSFGLIEFRQAQQQFAPTDKGNAYYNRAQ